MTKSLCLLASQFIKCYFGKRDKVLTVKKKKKDICYCWKKTVSQPEDPKSQSTTARTNKRA